MGNTSLAFHRSTLQLNIIFYRVEILYQKE